MEQQIPKQSIAPGVQVGMLTVLYDTGERKNRSVVWRCRCACGRERDVSTRELHDGRVPDCGCVSSRSLLGQRFGRLTVVEDLGTSKRGKIHLWRCSCDCGSGKDVIVTQDHLKQGMTKSCGCLHDEIGKENLKLVAGTSITKLEKRRGKVNVDNTSGYTGVYAQVKNGKKTGRWVAQIGFRGKRYWLGSYDSVEQAAAAREEAEKRLYDRFLSWYYEKYGSGKGVQEKMSLDP